MVEVRREGVLLEPTDRGFERHAVCNPGCVRVGGKVMPPGVHFGF